MHRALGLTDWEADRIRELLGRDPNHFELAVFSLLWSEHCGYKHSAPLLKRLPSAGERVLQGPGENAGVLDLGDGTAVAFKVESHNHPSAVEPFQGAATGIGGILRDVIAMGARPIALLDGLWFGEPDFHFQQAVAGIGHYGNCVGVPTVGGQTVFDPAYGSNCLVNAMCVGVLESDRLRSAKATGPGRLVVLYGATTGRDGIGGASVLASAELSEDDADKRPSVQVGDPFTGKKLIEVSLELVESGLVESLQDCGAAGLASALSEMAADEAEAGSAGCQAAVARPADHAASGRVGIDVHLDRVPLREEAMEPWEIMISESQERMVAVVRPEMLDAVHTVCARWELPCTAIGEVTDSGALRAFHDGDVVGEIPARLLTDECPRYEVEQHAEARPVRRPAAPAFDVREVIEQYDHLVGSRTVRRPGLDAAVLRLRPSRRGLAVALQGPAPGETDGYRAGVQATLGAARNVACAGSEPIGLTDCLNFGNPEKPAIAHELAQAIEGIAQAAEALRIPVVSGNVSLYNDADGASIPPTPVVGCVGLVPDVRRVPGRWQSGDAVLLATAPDGSLAAEAALIRFLWKAAPHLSLCHDVGRGGVAAALAEATAWSGGVEAEVELPDDYDSRRGAAILACRPARVGRLGSRGFVQIGQVR
ncbi:MAG TPA: phosphoribosylformylglycinamidine synthase subunit PurL [Gaiellaceae bacterium]|nr:phosphoribosylformylglycinamidine synthase subunit PurL [Gaiellaceae bacterium]